MPDSYFDFDFGYPALIMAVNCIIRNMRAKVGKGRTEKNQSWETAKLCLMQCGPLWILTKRRGPQAPSAAHRLLCLTFCPIDRANIIADDIENQLKAHGLCNCDHRRNVSAKVEALLAECKLSSRSPAGVM